MSMSIDNNGAPGTPGADLPIVSPVRGTSTGEVLGAPPAAPEAPEAPKPGSTTTAAAPEAPKPGTRTTIQMDEAALNERLARAKRQALIETFGTDDPAQIKALKDKAATLEKEAEERKRAAMSETERLKHDLAMERQARQRVRAELEQVRERQVVQEQQQVVERIASRHVAPQYVQDAAFLFAKHLRDNVAPADLVKMTDKDIGKWFQTFVNRRPAFSASATTRTRPRAPAGAPAPAPRPQAPQPAVKPDATMNGKSLKPGQPNSMTREEARAFARKSGYSW